ncbi:MAG: carboxyl transferase domain-containing protein, partial [Bacillota bacterium]|nr:carboxyl transferase domain-containing protein [Bacillota bacterium]
MKGEDLQDVRERILKGGRQEYHEKNRQQGKLFARQRIEKLLDPGRPFLEEGLFAKALDEDLPADGVITGIGYIHGRPVCIMANDSTVKAGSWGAHTVEKILRIQEVAMERRWPILYLVDSAGARITDQVEMFPGRRGAGRIFYNQVQLSGQVPQVCLLFGPSAAGGAYIPAFCDVVVMVEGNASMYLGSPRMAEMVIGEKVTLEEMGGARMHCTVSGVGDVLVATEEEALLWGRRYLEYLMEKSLPAREPAGSLLGLVPEDQNRPFDMKAFIRGLVDEGSFLEI